MVGENPLTSNDCMERLHDCTSSEEIAVRSSIMQDAKETKNNTYIHEVDDDDEPFYDAEDAFSSHKASYERILPTTDGRDSADSLPVNCYHRRGAASCTSEEFFEVSSVIPTVHREKSFSCGSLMDDGISDLHFGRPIGSALELRFCSRLTYSLADDQVEEQECSRGTFREKMVLDLKQGSHCITPLWLKGRKTVRDSSIPTWRGFRKGMFARSTQNTICRPKTVEQRQLSACKFFEYFFMFSS
ncbi:hypothetical protein COOONC_08070 [Cooperia oncophora]